MKKIYFILAALCIATLFASCKHDQTPDVLAFGGDVEVEMNIVTTSQGQTRAVMKAEDNINDLCVLVFDASNAANNAEEKEIEAESKFLYYRHAWSNGTDTYRAVLKTGANLRIYLAANVKVLIEEDNLLQEGDTYETVRKKLILTDPDKLVFNNLPMWGIVGGLTTISESDSYVKLGKISMLRSVASADLEIKDNDFTFERAGIVRATSLGYLTHEADNVKSVINENTQESVLRVIDPKVPEGADYSYSWNETPVDGKIVNKFYLFENDATETTVPGKFYTKLIVEGKYNNGPTTYYPLAFRNKENKKVQAARNRKFEITVTKVNGPGFPTIDEAINSEDVNMGYEVVIWDNDYKDSDIIVDGPYYVSFSGRKIILLADQKESDAICWFTTNVLEWEGTTPKNLTWSFDKMDDNTPKSKGNSISNDRFKVEILKEKPSDPKDENFYFKVTALEDYKNVDAGSHTATLSVKIGRIQFEIRLQQLDNGWRKGGEQPVDL